MTNVDRSDSLKTVAETAQAMRLSPHTIRAWIATRRLGHVRLGRAIRVPSSEIQRLLEQGTVPAMPQTWAAARGRREVPDTSDSGKHISRGRGGGVTAPALCGAEAEREQKATMAEYPEQTRYRSENLVAQKEDDMTLGEQIVLVAEARRIVRGETMMIGTTQHVKACLLTLDEVQARLHSYEQVYPNPMREAAV